MTKLQIISKAESLPREWDQLVEKDLFLQKNYLLALEAGRPDNIGLLYLLIYKNSNLAAVAVIQHVKLYLQDIFRKNTGNAITRLLRKGVSSILKGHILVVGNLTHTGQHGLFFDEDKIERTEFLVELFKGLYLIAENIKNQQNKKIRLFLLKDYYAETPLIQEATFLDNNSLYEVTVQPNMVMQLHDHWNNIEDYYIELSKKYKRRFRTAKKKFGEIMEVEFSLQDIKDRSIELSRLYHKVSDNAKFNTFFLPENHFYEFKSQLEDKFKVYGLFLDKNLIGFYSLIINNSTLETYFLGYDPEHQINRQLYLNMLYKMLQFGIENKYKGIVYARTAMEIKSSVGARPKEMLMYIKHTNKVLNSLMKPIFKLLDPTRQWEERHPFRQ